MSYIEIYDGAGSRRIPVGGYYTLGRALHNDVVLYGAAVSRHHGRLTVREGRVILEDIGSTHGTSINGRPLLGPHILRDGDQIRMGDAWLIYRHPARGAVVHAPAPAYALPMNRPGPNRLAQPPLAANLIRCVHCGAANLKNNTLCYHCGNALLDSLDTPLRSPAAQGVTGAQRSRSVSPHSQGQVIGPPRWLVALLAVTIVAMLCLMGLLVGMLLAGTKLSQGWTAFAPFMM
jgi:hypothetical protein